MAAKGKPAEIKPAEEKTGGFLSNIRLTRTTAIEIAALVTILAVAIILRIMPLRWGEYFNEYDPYLLVQDHGVHRPERLRQLLHMARYTKLVPAGTRHSAKQLPR